MSKVYLCKGKVINAASQVDDLDSYEKIKNKLQELGFKELSRKSNLIVLEHANYENCVLYVRKNSVILNIHSNIFNKSIKHNFKDIINAKYLLSHISRALLHLKNFELWCEMHDIK